MDQGARTDELGEGTHQYSIAQLGCHEMGLDSRCPCAPDRFAQKSFNTFNLASSQH